MTKNEFYIGANTPMGIFIEEKIDILEKKKFLKIFCGSSKIIYSVEKTLQEDKITISRYSKSKKKIKISDFFLSEKNFNQRIKYKNGLIYILEDQNPENSEENLLIVVPEYNHSILKICPKWPKNTQFRIRSYLPLDKKKIFLLVQNFANDQISLVEYKINWEEVKTKLDYYRKNFSDENSNFFESQNPYYKSDIGGGEMGIYDDESRKFEFESVNKENFSRIENFGSTPKKIQTGIVFMKKETKLSIQKKKIGEKNIFEEKNFKKIEVHQETDNMTEDVYMNQNVAKRLILEPSETTPKKILTENNNEIRRVYEIEALPLKRYKFLPSEDSPISKNSKKNFYFNFFIDFTSSSNHLICILQSEQKTNESQKKIDNFKTESYIFKVISKNQNLKKKQNFQISPEKGKIFKNEKISLELTDCAMRYKNSELCEISSKISIKEHTGYLFLYKDFTLEIWILVNGFLAKFDEQNLSRYFSNKKEDSFDEIRLSKKNEKLLLGNWTQQIELRLRKNEDECGEWVNERPEGDIIQQRV